MKSILILLLSIAASITSGQQFIKVTEGSHVNDGGDSRSVNWIDYDGDSHLDLFVSNGPQGGQNNFLYKNNGDGTFTKITGTAVTSDNRSSDGSTWGDYDNDGDPDLFVANWYNQNNLLYKNNGDGTFELISGSAITSDGGYSESGTWGDYNNDSFLDLYVCNSEGVKRNYLYKNNGDGTFSKIIAGPQSTDAFNSRNADWIDLNSDNYADLFITNELNQNENFYTNNKDGSFTSAQIPGLLTSGGSSTSSSWEDINNDGHFDVFVANYDAQKNFIFMNNGDGTFTKVNDSPVTEDTANSFGSAFGDIDNDGDLDLFVTNAFGAGPMKNFFYLNNGDGTFTKDNGFDSETGWTYGCAFGDYDKNGWLDLFLAKCFGAAENNVLFKNLGGDNNWFVVDLEGTASNRSAIGAVVKIKADIAGSPVWQMRRTAGQTGYCGQTLQLHFGLGDSEIIDTLIILWPSGAEQIMTDVNVNQHLKITEDPASSVETGEAVPGSFMLYQNYPNPFNPLTSIKFQIPERTMVTLKLYDLLGNEIAVLLNDEKAPGNYETKVDGAGLSSGVYFYRLQAGSFTGTKKMILLK